MKPESLLRDPVFHLNLLLWMAKEQPSDGHRVRPFFHEQGFRIIRVEQPFPLPPETSRAIEVSSSDISFAPEPELILSRQADKKALYFEAKSDSFAPDSTNARQAQAHLLASGSAFAEVLDPLSSCMLCYVLPEERRAPMAECLTALTHQLRGLHLEPGVFSVHGLSIQEESMVYAWDSAFKRHVGIEEDCVEVLAGLTEDTDPAPLLLVFSDEDCHNEEMRDFYRQALIEQVRACLLCDLHSLPLGVEYATTPDDLLLKTTDGVFEFLGGKRQKRLRRLVRENVFKRIREYWQDKQRDVALDHNCLTIQWRTTEEKEQFLNWLEDRRTTFGVTKPPDEQPSLFE